MRHHLTVWLLGVASVSHISASGNDVTLPLPIFVPPSGQWDGIDGPWSSFWVDIGTPSQSVRLLPSTSRSNIWPIIEINQTAQYATSYPILRGEEFYTDLSSSWRACFTMNNTNEEQLLGYSSADPSSGLDNITFGLPGNSSYQVLSQVISGVNTDDFYYGFIGLNSHDTNIKTLTSNSTVSIPSLLTSLRNQNSIPSLTWGYTAGAYYKQPPSLGSLTLGGYDSLRLMENGVSFPFGSDPDKDLLVEWESISSDLTNTTYSWTPIPIFLDSTVPDMWLPLSICETIKDLYGLSYNKSSNYYVANQMTMQFLIDQNPLLTFNLRSKIGNKSLAISLAYASFDVVNPVSVIDGTDTQNFPLRRAKNEDQYTLGRVLFQEVYVIADYERRNFSISQALFPNASVKPDIRTILPINLNAATDQAANKFDKDAIIGVTLGLVCLLLVTVLLSWLLWRRKRRNARLAQSNQEKADQQPLNNVHMIGKPEACGDSSRVEMTEKSSSQHVRELGDLERQEMNGSHGGQELSAPLEISELSRDIEL